MLTINTASIFYKMPHLIIEYSSNLAAKLEVQTLVDRVHTAALETGMFKIGAVRTRATARDFYRIADGHPDNGFIHLVLRIAQGRETEAKRRAGEAIFEAICNELQPLFETTPLGISFEIQEIEQSLSFKKNNLHELVQRRTETLKESS